MKKSAEWALSLIYLDFIKFFAELAMPCGKMNLPQRVNKQVPRGGEERHEIITHISFPDAIVKCNITEEGH